MYSELIGNYEKYRIKSLYGNKLTINSLSNSIRQFKNNIKEAGMILGQLFAPILSKVMPIVNGLTIAIKQLMVSIAGIMGIKLDLSEFGQGTSNVSDEAYDIADGLDAATESAEKLQSVTLGFDELHTFSQSEESGGGGVSSGVSGGIDLTEQILTATEEYETVWQEAYDRMENEAMKWADRIAKALEPVKKIFEDIAIGDWFAVGQDVSNLVSGIFDFFAKAIDKVDWEQLGQNIGNFLAGLDWEDMFTSAGGVIKEALIAVLEFGEGVYNSKLAEPLKTTYRGINKTTGEVINETASATKQSFDELGKWLNETFVVDMQNSFKGFSTTVGTNINETASATKKAFDDAKLWVKIKLNDISFSIQRVFLDAKLGLMDIWQSFSGWITDNVTTPISTAFETACDKIGGFFNELWKGIKKGVVSAFNVVIAVVENTLNWLVKGINDIISGFNRVVSWAANIIDVDWGGVSLLPEVSLGRIEVSAYKNGGVVEDGLFYANHNELVGQFANGRTAVANNDQIIAGIEQGVYKAVVAALASQNTQPIDIHSTILLDGEKVYDNQQRVSAKRGYNFGMGAFAR